MKKILLLLICLIMIGCGKDNNQNVVNPTPNPEPKEEIIYYTEEEAQIRLKEIADDVYQNNKYLNYPKKDGKHFISLKELRDSLKYDTKKIDYIDGLKCDENETGIGIDIDNLEKVDYVGNPVITYMLCNPPSADNNS